MAPATLSETEIALIVAIFCRNGNVKLEPAAQAEVATELALTTNALGTRMSRLRTKLGIAATQIGPKATAIPTKTTTPKTPRKPKAKVNAKSKSKAKVVEKAEGVDEDIEEFAGGVKQETFSEYDEEEGEDYGAEMGMDGNPLKRKLESPDEEDFVTFADITPASKKSKGNKSA